MEGDAQLIDVGMEYLVHESYTRGLEGILVWKLNMDLPYAAGKRC